MTCCQLTVLRLDSEVQQKRNIYGFFDHSHDVRLG